MPVYRNARRHLPTQRDWTIALRSVFVVIVFVTSSATARAEDNAKDESPLRPFGGQLGAGLGGSWLPLRDGSIAIVVARASVGLDLGRYSLRALPSFQYGTIRDHSRVWKVFLGYLALENVVRVTPTFALSLAPLVGYGTSPDPNITKCTDSCSEPIGSGVVLGVDASPATFTFGRDGSFELGLHADTFVFKDSGNIWPGAYLDLRRTFFQL